jgi:uncharacterized LabA/DUF88 family protein
MSQPRVYLAVDAANLLYSRARGTWVNYAALLRLAEQRGKVVESAIYLPRARELDKERARLLELKYMGFTRVISRQLRERPDQAPKSDIDIAIALDLWDAATRGAMDVVVLASGDSDFVPLVERLGISGKAVDVIGPSGATAWELIVASTQFLYADQVDGLIQPADTRLAATAQAA